MENFDKNKISVTKLKISMLNRSNNAKHCQVLNTLSYVF